MYNSVTKSVLIHSCEVWTLNCTIERNTEIFETEFLHMMVRDPTQQELLKNSA